MPDIRYVCLSDMHFGADNSLLTCLEPGHAKADPMKPSPVLVRLVECLKHLIEKNEGKEKPTLILNGDILELALTTDNRAAMAFECFLALLMPRDQEPLFDKKIIYIPGNHDHHLWETARETQYLKFITSVPLGTYLDIPWHATNLFIEKDPDPLPCGFLNTLARRLQREDVFFVTAYPNFGLLQDNHQKCVIFHHGHFTESIYTLMSTFKTLIFPDRKRPIEVWDLEAENFAWIDFFWSTMGRSGEVGQDVGLIYDKMQDKKVFKELLYNLAIGLAKQYALPGWGLGIKAQLLSWILGATVGRVAELERHQTEQPLSPNGQHGLRSYMEGPLRQQLLSERDRTVPPEVTFVFGHTHKPFEQDMSFAGYLEPVHVYNSGGWVVDTVNAQPVTGGAAILVDEEFNAASLRLYNETAAPGDYAVKVEQAAHEGVTSNPFFQRIAALVDASQDPWKAFSQRVAESVRAHAENLKAKIKRPA